MKLDEADKLIAYYYLKPEPARVPEAVHALSKAGYIHGQPILSWWAVLNSKLRKSSGLVLDLWSEKSDYNLIIFLAEVLRVADVKPGDWYRQLEALPQGQLRSIWLAFWCSERVDALNILREQARHTSIRDRWFLQFLANIAPTPALEFPLEGPLALDICWAYFSATGDLDAVNKVVTALSLFAEPEHSPLYKVALAAQWSLKSQASQHEIIATHIRNLLDEVTDKGMHQMLEEILE